MKIHKIIASGLGTGYSPVAPGTMGSLLGIGMLYGINTCFNKLGFQSNTSLVIDLAAIVLVLFMGVYSIKIVHQQWEHDDSKIVVDEIVGVWIAAFALPLVWWYYLAAFILFRVFDIIKPFGIRSIDRLNGHWSVMLDDVLAGVYAFIVVQVGLHFQI